jgi:hypothetical protein
MVSDEKEEQLRRQLEAMQAVRRNVVDQLAQVDCEISGITAELASHLNAQHRPQPRLAHELAHVAASGSVA